MSAQSLGGPANDRCRSPRQERGIVINRRPRCNSISNHQITDPFQGIEPYYGRSGLQQRALSISAGTPSYFGSFSGDVRQDILQFRNERRELLDESGIDTGHHHAVSYGSTACDSGEEAIEEAWDAAASRGLIHTSKHHEIKLLCKNSAPLALAFFLQYSLVVASFISVGHIGKIELGAISIASMTASVTGIAFTQGMATSLDTLCGQAYGAGQKHLVGLFFQKCSLLTFIFFVPIYICWCFADKLLPLVLSSSEPELIQLAADYLRIFGLGIPGYILFECGKRYLQAQGIFHASTVVLGICAPINVLLNYVLVWNKHIGLGFHGAPIAVAFTDWLMAIMLLVYTMWTLGSDCWVTPSLKELFTGWGCILRLSLPGVLMVETEFLAFELMTLATARLGTETLAAQTVLSTVTSLAFQIPFSVSIVVSTRIANFIGAGAKGPALTVLKAAYTLSLALSVCDSLALFVFRYPIAALFTSEPEIVELTASVFQMCSIQHFFDSNNAVLGGVLRGQGRQKIGGFINLAGYYAVGLPLAFILTFVYELGLAGLWLGISIGLVFIVSASLTAVTSTNWDQIIMMSKRNIYRG